LTPVFPDGNERIFIFIYTIAFGERWIYDVTLTSVGPQRRGKNRAG
jgi:hypothetical protein